MKKNIYIFFVLFRYSLVIINTLIGHSGYHLPFLPSSEAHDFHHLRFNVNYGTLGILDYLHGTDVQFRNNKAYDRHVTLTSSKSARELFPDTPNAQKEQ